MSETSLRFSRAQFVAWLQILGESDDEESENSAEEHARILYDQDYLRCTSDAAGRGHRRRTDITKAEPYLQGGRVYSNM